MASRWFVEIVAGTEVVTRFDEDAGTSECSSDGATWRPSKAPTRFLMRGEPSIREVEESAARRIVDAQRGR